MARKGKNTRKVVQPVSGRQATDFNISDTTGLLDKRQKGAWEEQIRLAGKMNDKVTDLAGKYEDIFTTQQGMLQETNALYGIEKQTLSNLAAIANKKKIIELSQQNTRDMSIQQRNILTKTISDYSEYNSLAADVAKRAAELNNYRKTQIPFENKIKSIQAEIVALKSKETDTLGKQEKARLKELGTMETQYKTLSKQTQVLDRIEKTQNEIDKIMTGQVGAAGKIFQTLKDIVTNPLTIMTGLLAIGLQRYETMRQRGVQIGEQQDRINKKLAGAGPFQDKIIQKATLIRDRFYQMGEGFASSLEGSVDAIVALSDQFGKIDYVTGDLVKTMAELKLSIGLSDEASAQVLDNFMTVNGLSSEAAISMTEMTYQMSEQAGLNPQQVFQDIAAASGDTLATFSGSADELAKSAVTARRLGITLDDMASVSRGLLDFETSIEKEMEAQLITGIDLNLQKARSLAMQGKEAEAMEEVMKQVGGLDRFNKMQPLQQRALADAVGLTVGQLQKTSKQREQEAIHATKKHDLVEKQYAMAEKALPLLGKLDVGLGVMERIAVVLGDLFLDVFGDGIADLEKTFFKFLESPLFKTGFKNTLYFIKGIIVGVKDAVLGLLSLIDKASFGTLGTLAKTLGSTDLSGGYKGAETGGKVLGTMALAYYTYQKTLGTRLNPMFVKMKDGLGSVFGGGGGMGGRSLLGMPLGSSLGGSASAGMMKAGGTALGTAGTVLGGVLGVAALGKGIYDVATIKSQDTAREKATAVGGLGGALGGAATGALIGSVVPIVGTVLGAGIGAVLGYFGGRAVGSIDAFRDDMDVLRDQFAESEQNVQNNLAKRAESNNRRIMKKTAKATDLFLKLADEAGDVTGDALKQLQSDLVDTGLISKKMFRQMAKDGKVTQDEMNRLLAGITDSRPIDPDFDRNASKEEKQALKNIEARELRLVNEFAEITKDITALQAYTKDFKGLIDQNATVSQTNDFEGQIIPYDKTGGFKKGSDTYPYVENFMDNPAMDKYLDRVLGQLKMTVGTDAMTPDEWSEIMEAMQSRMYNYDSDNTINQMLEGVAKWGKELTEGKLQTKLDNNSKVVTDQTLATENVQSVTADNVISLDSNLTATEANTISNIELTKTIKKQEVKVAKDKSAYDKTVDQLVTEPVLNLLLKNPSLLKMIFAKGGVLSNKTYAGGGITYGPSHAQGGIPTRYGELEGGEAVINKRSTSMFAGELSRINQAGGGVSFADGGVTREFAKGGIVDPMQNKQAVDYSHAVNGLWTKSIPAYHMRMSDFPYDITPGRGGTYGKSSGYQQTPRALDIYDKYVGLHGRPSLHAENDKYMGFNSHSLKKWHDKSYIDPDAVTRDKKRHAERNAANNADWIPNMFQNMSTGTSKGAMANDMRLATSPVAESVANASQVGAEWTAAILGSLIGGSALGSGGAAWMGRMVPKAASGAYRLARAGVTQSSGAMTGGFTQMRTGATFLNKLMGGLKSFGGASTLFSQAKGAWDLVSGKGDTSDIANVFLGGIDQRWLKGFTDAATYTSKGEYLKAALSLAPQSIGALVPDDVLEHGSAAYEAYYSSKGGKEMLSKLLSWFSGDSDEANLASEAGLTSDNVRSLSPIARSPIKKVNDMILTKDGQMIETHADDNLIAKKGAITQNPAGGGSESRVEELLKQLIMVTQQGGDVYMDGSKVSAVINQTNYNV